MQELRESIRQGEPFAEARVSREDGLIQGVSLLGKVSANGRIYTDEAMEQAVQAYRNAPVYLDHPTRRELSSREGQRSVKDLAGRVRNPRLVGNRVKGDVEVLQVEPARSLLLSIASQAPDLAGMSHRARGEVRVDDDGTQRVTSLDRVFGVELVTEPATVSGLLESINAGGATGVSEQAIREVEEELEERGVPAGTLGRTTLREIAEAAGERREKFLADYADLYERNRRQSRGHSASSRPRSVERSVEEIFTEHDPESSLEEGVAEIHDRLFGGPLQA